MRIRNFIHLIIGAFFVLAMPSRASAQKVSVDFDPHAAFSDYKTFMWIERVHYPGDPLMETRVMDAIDAALMSKGLQKVPDGAHIGVTAHIATKEEQSLETFYTGFGGGWRWACGGPLRYFDETAYLARCEYRNAIRKAGKRYSET
jgi:hypothetical protein